MPDIRKTIMALNCRGGDDSWDCNECPYYTGKSALSYKAYCDSNGIMKDAADLLKNSNERYAEMTIEWLHEIIMNNFEDEHQIRYIDALEDIRDRAIHGLKNYYDDMQT